MTPGRALLYATSVGAIGLGVRSVTRGAVPVEVAAGAVVAFASVVMAGVVEPRLGMFADVVNRGEPRPDAPRLALTFDDGPSLEHTPRVLDALAAAGARATFFVIGRKLEGERARLVRRAHDEGHAIGCHGHAHDRLFALRSARRVRDDLKTALAAIADVTGSATSLFRPPIGHTNPTIASVAEELDLDIIGFSVRGYDGTARADEAKVRARLISGLADGAIALLHDGAERDDFTPVAPAILPDVLGAMRDAGIAGVTVSELIAPVD
ncbi:MAG: polysaccharide deacetylase family protein [Deltaproteobacteria bacterium]|nr:polysaccharide deacetylase family protein [Deltaproteobacteria bacterium]